MSRQEKILDVLALSRLSVGERLNVLAHRHLNKPLPVEQAKAIIRCFFDKSEINDLSKMALSLIQRKLAQEELRKDRDRNASLLQSYTVSPLVKFRGPRGLDLMRRRKLEIAKRVFGPHIKENFNDTTLSMMSLIKGEDLAFEVRWISAGFQPALSAVIAVVTTFTTRMKEEVNFFLLYKNDGVVRVARIDGASLVAMNRVVTYTEERLMASEVVPIEDAWVLQISSNTMTCISEAQKNGLNIRSNLDKQTVEAIDDSGRVVDSWDWAGKIA
jgi:hypothetical protein